MGKYVIKRLLQLIPVALGITFLSFAMMRLAGGDAVTYMYENAGTAVSQEIINEARAEYGLDQPFLVQYGKWLKECLQEIWEKAMSRIRMWLRLLQRSFLRPFFWRTSPRVRWM